MTLLSFIKPRDFGYPKRLSSALLVASAALIALAAQPAARAESPTPAPHASETPATRDVRQLWDAEHTWVRALETADLALLGRLIDDQFTFISPDGNYEDRKTYLAGYRELAEGRIQVQKIELDDVKFRLLGDTGIVTGHVLARAKMGETLIVESVRFTRVYQRRGERWRMVAGQGTRVPTAPSR
jgi:ketosteroid isomerase-like protein